MSRQKKGFIATRRDDRRRAYGMGEVGMMYGVSRDTIKRHVKDGSIRAIRLGGRILIPAAELDRLEREGTVAEAS